jgi:oligopeptide transport system ATP-binding protein
MYLGTMIEMGASNQLYDYPLHPYTQALLSAIPVADPASKNSRSIIPIEGEVPSPINPKPGCRFAPRCRYAKDICRNESPELKEVVKEHFVACHIV